MSVTLQHVALVPAAVRRSHRYSSSLLQLLTQRPQFEYPAPANYVAMFLPRPLKRLNLILPARRRLK
jgi:hypothetical protein